MLQLKPAYAVAFVLFIDCIIIDQTASIVHQLWIFCSVNSNDFRQ